MNICLLVIISYLKKSKLNTIRTYILFVLDIIIYSIKLRKLERDIMFVVDKRDAKANVQKTIRFTEEVYQNLNEVAVKENVSFNALVLQCCRYALSNMEKKDNKRDL